METQKKSPLKPHAFLIRRSGKILLFAIAWMIILHGQLLFGGTLKSVRMRFEQISTDHGLSNSVVNTIHQDSQGFLWIGTQNGLNRYDGQKFKIFRYNPTDPNSLPDNFVRDICEDSQGNLWIATSGGLARLDRNSESFDVFRTSPNGMRDSSIRCLTIDHKGRLWIGTFMGGLHCFDPKTETFRVFQTDANDPNTISQNYIENIFEDHNGTLWVGSGTNGLNRFNEENATFTRFQFDPNNDRSLPHNHTKAIFEDQAGNLWVTSFSSHFARFDKGRQDFDRFELPVEGKIGGITAIIPGEEQDTLWMASLGAGLIKFNTSTHKFYQWKQEPADPHSLANNHIRAMIRDQGGIIWLGTYEGGLQKLNPATAFFNHYRQIPGDPTSLSGSSVRAFLLDQEGKIWVGTDGGGISILDPNTNAFSHRKHDPNDPKGLAHNGVIEIYQDRQGKIWIGTYGGGVNLWDPDTGTMTHFKGIGGFLPDPHVKVIFQDDADYMWFGTYGGGLMARNFETEENRYYQYDEGNPKSLASDRVWSIFPDEDGRLWLGTYGGGLSIFDPETQTFENYNHNPNDPESVSNNNVFAVFQDSKGQKWLTTSMGFCKITTGDSVLRFQNFGPRQGLAGISAYAILEDNDGFLWISTDGGLSKFDPVSHQIETYTEKHGLQGNEFKEGAYLRHPNGSLLFGGINGFNWFDPKTIQKNQHIPPVVLTGFAKFNRQVQTGALSNYPQGLPLTHKDTVFSLSFAALDYADPIRNRYRYRLEGFHDEWIELGNRTDVTFTNLDSGTYTFFVQAANNDDVWNPSPAQLLIKVKPAPWRTWWAYMLYGLAIITILTTLHKLRVAVHRREVKRQQELVRSLQKVDRLKDQILANTSHELRTPLHGIVGIAESLLEGIAGNLPEKAVENLKMIANSGNRLSFLVNDILDFSRLRHRQIEIAPVPLKLAPIVDHILSLNHAVAQCKGLTLENHIPENLQSIMADPLRLQQVLQNVIGNAVKFTDCGKVSIRAKQLDGEVEIAISDTGIGIGKNHFERIFLPFEQGDGSTERKYGGTGLGLAISKHIVEVHGGSIQVDSVLGEGSIFTIRLPSSEQMPVEFSINQPISRPIMETGQEVFKLRSNNPNCRYRILIVDDEPINLQVLNNFLDHSTFQVIAAADGAQALERMGEPSPQPPFDLILLDIMMPKVSGYDVCRKIRENYRLQDLPIILLTAKNQISDLVSGFNAGANDYLIKPVSKGELMSRVRTHLGLLDATRTLEDYNRALEDQVAKRTKDLITRNEELETLNEIIKQVHGKVNRDEVRDTLLSQARILFPKADTHILLSDAGDRSEYKVDKAFSQGHINWVDARLPTQWFNRQLNQQTPDRSGVWQLHPKEIDQAPNPLQSFQSLLIMNLDLQVPAKRLLLLGSLQRAEAFDDTDLEKCGRYRDHALTALTKAQMFHELEESAQFLKETQEQLLQAAHLAGMAEIATEVLHNAGNILNSVNISAERIHESLDHNQPLSLLEKLLGLLQVHKDDLVEFLTLDQKGRKVPMALRELLLAMHQINDQLKSETGEMRHNIHLLRQIIQDQLKFTGVKDVESHVNIAHMARELISRSEGILREKNIEFIQNIQPTPEIFSSPNKILHLLSGLMETAIEAVSANLPPKKRVISLTTGPERETGVRIVISDNGSAPKDLTELFRQAPGKGRLREKLHFAANAVATVQGRIWAEPLDARDEGGVSIIITLPAAQQSQR